MSTTHDPSDRRAAETSLPAARAGWGAQDPGRDATAWETPSGAGDAWADPGGDAASAWDPGTTWAPAPPAAVRASSVWDDDAPEPASAWETSRGRGGAAATSGDGPPERDPAGPGGTAPRGRGAAARTVMSGARGRTTAATGFGGARAAVGEVAAHAAAGGPDGRRSRSQQPGSTGSDATGPDSTGIDSTPLGGPVPGEAPVVRVQDPQERRRVADELRDRLDALHRSTGASRVLPAVAGTVGAAPSTGGPADASPPVDAAGTGGSRASARAVSTAGGTPADPEPRVPGAPEPNPEVRAQPDAGDGPDRAWSDDTGAPDERTTSAPRRTGLPARGGRRRAPASEPPPTGSAAADAEPDPESVARSVALRLLTGAPRSRAQLAEAMAKRDVPEEVADRVLDRFTEVGLVDDAAYAEILVRSRHQERKLSRRALAQELRRRGVDDDVAREALEQVGEDDEEQAARALARKKLAATRGLDREVRLRRAYGALGRRGYGGSLVSRVVREELAAEGQDDDSPWGDRGA